MNKENIEMDNEMLDEVESQAEMEAAADFTAEKSRTAEEVNKQISYIVSLSREYDLDGKKIKEIDLGGLEDLTTADAQEVDRVMERMRHHPQNKFRDIMYTKHIAMKVTKLPVEFFNGLLWKDMESVTSRIMIYFLL
ncbi:MAG: hypothetical protein OSJ71_06400 [Acetatifactor sp.]|nr:hypothetical protein [Acetatifactor sp.]